MAAAVTLGVVTAEAGLRTSSGVTTTTVLLEPHIVRGVLFSLKTSCESLESGIFFPFLSLVFCLFVRVPFRWLGFFYPDIMLPANGSLILVKKSCKNENSAVGFFLSCPIFGCFGKGGGGFLWVRV